jgi:hypothetical protein
MLDVFSARPVTDLRVFAVKYHSGLKKRLDCKRPNPLLDFAQQGFASYNKLCEQADQGRLNNQSVIGNNINEMWRLLHSDETSE